MAYKVEFTEVLDEFDAPLVAIARSAQAKNYLCVAVHDPEHTNPYLCVAINQVNLDRIRHGDLDIKSAIINPSRKSWYVANFHENEGTLKRLTGSIWEVPHEYIPGDGYFVASTDTNQSAPRSNISVGIDGDWSPNDFQDVNNVYNQLYAVVYLLDQGNQAAIEAEVIAHPYRDGFSSMHMHNRLFAAIPRYDRPRLNSVQYASPGHIEFSGMNSANVFFVNTLELVRNNFDSLSRIYSEAYASIKSSNLLGLDVAHYSSSKYPGTSTAFKSHSMAISDAINLSDLVGNKLNAANELGRLRLMLYIMRRMFSLSELVYGRKIVPSE